MLVVSFRSLLATLKVAAYLSPQICLPMKTKPYRIVLLSFTLLSLQKGHSQESAGMIRTTDGLAITYKSSFIADCKKMYGLRTVDSLANKACECQANVLNNYVTNHQLSFYRKRYKEKALQALIEQDVFIQRKISDCLTPSRSLQLASTSSPGKKESETVWRVL